MRMLMTVQMDTETASRSIQDGTMPKAIDSTLQQLQPEAAFFTTRDGQRTAYIVFDLRDPADMPAVAEPFFMGTGAKVDISPAMNIDELQEGLSRLP